jgi:Cof subfamily protein (haloacid dehalogenase superfamily)
MTHTIKLIVTDLDGTLLNNQHQLSAGTIQAIQAAQQQGVKLILATGKTYGSARAIIEQLQLDTPGIFVQGLVIHNADGSIRHQVTLDPAVARQAITFAEERGFSLIAFSGHKTLVRRRDYHTNMVVEYGEPEPEVVGPLQNILDKQPINKIIAIRRNGARQIKALRWQLSAQLNGASRLMQPGEQELVEVLPKNQSKGTALKILLKELNIAPEHVMAIGDGENDVEMLEVAGLAIAVDNAQPVLKKVADHVVASNDADGVAEAIRRFVLPPAVPEQTAPPENPVLQEVENKA